MKNSRHSIQTKIFKSMSITVIIFLLLLLIGNATILDGLKKDVIYRQLTESAETKLRNDHRSKGQETSEATLWVPHFLIETKEDTYNLVLNQFTNSIYPNDSKNSVIQQITQNIITNDFSDLKDNITIDRIEYYYILLPEPDSDSSDSMVVFFTSYPRKTEIGPVIFLFLILLLILSYLTSIITAKKITKPIQSLEDFASEISRKNWSAEIPQMEPDEIGHLAISLASMRDSLKKADERDRKFLQSSSHDLKTPVMVIKGYAQAMIDGVTLDKDISIPAVLLSESEKLEHRIIQLLRLNTIDHSLEHTETRDLVRIDRIISRLLTNFNVLAPSITIESNLKPLEISGDSEALLIAFENIFDNQMRYAKNSIIVTVNPNDKGLITIENDGQPFMVEDPSVLFDPYEKANDGHFGLGLAIVKKVIESHGGSITAANSELGVIFTIQL